MKTPSHMKSRVWPVALPLTLAAAIFTTISLSGAAGSESSKKGDESLLLPLKKWQQQMSDSFRDTFKNLSPGKGAKSIVSADLREQDTSYTLRLSVPGRTLEKVEINLQGNELRIMAPEEANAGRYEQTIALRNVPSDATPQVDRQTDNHLIMVTVPKAGTPPPSRDNVPRSSSDNEGASLLRRDQEVMKSMEDMRQRMDRIFEDSFSMLRPLSNYKGWFDEHRFASTYQISSEGNDHIVRIYLPGRTMQNVTVNVEGETLLVDAESEDSFSLQPNPVPMAPTIHRARYTQRIALPGPVHAHKMEVQRKADMLVVTLPKAESR